ncbi:MAG: hypothetical protein KBB11_03715 [Bacteroidales bacterium]|nr:hypothetical protein [Bacteroidales bacterium]
MKARHTNVRYEHEAICASTGTGTSTGYKNHDSVLVDCFTSLSTSASLRSAQVLRCVRNDVWEEPVMRMLETNMKQSVLRRAKHRYFDRL